MRFFSIVSLGPIVAAGLLASCASSVKPLTTTPPAKAVRTEKFSWGDGIIVKKVTFPKGVYVPQGEDKNGHYYTPQNAQVQVFDTGMRYATKGGIYWQKGLVTPDQFYIDSWAGTAKFRKEIPSEPIR